MSDYENQLAELARARMDALHYKNEMTAMLKSVTDSPNYAAAKQAADEATANQERLEEQIRAQAVNDYAVTRNKHPHAKVEVKINKVFSVTDAALLLAWVKAKLADALIEKVDEKKVKSYALKNGAIDGTTITEESKAQIASEL